MALSAESIAEYKSSLKDLNVNSKPLINMLTMLAEDHEQHAAEIVKVIEDHINKCKPAKKLPVLYLIDSIMKNLGESTNYKSCFSKNIVQTFTSVFEQVDEKTRASMFKLRQTWTSILANSKLYMIDVRINNLMDPAWPVTATAPEKTSIHVNPKFLNKAGSSGSGSERSSPEMVFEEEDDAQEDVDPESLDQEAIMRQQLIAKQQELLELQQARIKLELAEAEEKLKSLGKHGGKSQTATTSKLSGLPLPPVVDNSDLIDPIWTAPQPAKDPRKKQPPDPRKRDPRLQMQPAAPGSEFMKGPQDMEGTVSSTVPFIGHPGGPMMGHPGGPMMGQGVPPHMPYPVMNQMDSMQFPHGVPPFVPRGFGDFKGMVYQEEAKFSDSNDSDSSRSSFQDNRSGQTAGQQKMNVKDPRLRKQYEEVQRRKSENKDNEQSNKSRDPRRPSASPKSSSGHQHKDPNESRESSKHSPKDPQPSRSSRDNTSSKSPRKSTSDTQTSKGRSTSKDRDSKSYPNLRDTFEAAKRKHDSDKEREKDKDSKFYKKDSGSRYSDRSSRSREKSPPHQSKHQSNKNSHKGSGDNSVSSKSAHDNRNRDRNKDNNSSKASNKKSSNHSDSKRGNKSSDSRQDSYKAPKSIKREKGSPEGEEEGRASKKPKLSIKEEPAEVKQEIKQEVDMEVDQKLNVNVSNDLSELFGSEDIDHRPVDAKGLPLKSPSSKGWDKFKASQPDQFAYDIELKKQRQDLDQRRTRQMSEACENQDTDYRIQGQGDNLMSPPIIERDIPSDSHLQMSEASENQDTDYRIQGQGDSLMSPPIIEREIPKELSLSQHSEIIIQAQKQLREGKITAKQHQDLMQQVQELMHIQQQLQDENSKTGENTQEMAAELSVSENSARNLFHSFESEVKQEPYNDESSLAVSQGYTENQGEGRVRSPDRPLERFRIPKKSHDANSPKKDKRGLHELYPERIKEEAWESGPPVLAREFDRPPDNMDHPDFVAPPNLNDSRRPPQNRRQDHRDPRGMNNRRERGGSAEKFREYPDDYNTQQGRRDQYDRPDGPPERRQGPPSDWPKHGDRQEYPPFDQPNEMGAPHPQDMVNPLDPRRRDPRLMPGREMDVREDQVHPDQKFMDLPPQDPNWIRSPRDEAERRDDIGRGRLREEEFHRHRDERGPFRNDDEMPPFVKGPMGRGHGPPDWEMPRPGFDQDRHPNLRFRDDPNMPSFDRHGPPYMGPEGHRSPPYGRPGPPDHEHGRQDPRQSDRDDHFSKRNSEEDFKKGVSKEIVPIEETCPGKRVIDANGVMRFIPDPGYESPAPQEKPKPESLVKPEFDREGPPRPEFGRDGHPRPEFDRDGPPRPEFDREGPPRSEFDRDGPPRFGFDREGPPRHGFDRDGPPRPGFEGPPRPEFDREGPPRPGFEGPPRPGFEGPPRPGFDREGPPRPGFEGPPRPGFDREGPPRPGFEGPPRPGFDREGPPRPGFEGPPRPEFDREGPPRPGFNREGPPRPGFDREGPPRPGFDREGPPRPGFDREGPPMPEFDRDGPPRPGFDGPHPPHPHPEFDRQGPNFDRPGPPRPEMDRPGPLDEKLRSPGYDDRMRPPGPEFDRPGRPDFDRPEPNFDRQGHPRPEFDRSGPPRPEFDRPGPPGNEFDRPGHPRSEFDRDMPGHPRPDFDRSGPPRPEFEGPDRGRPDFDRHGPPGPGFDGPRPLIPEFDRQGPEFDRQGRPGPEFDRPEHPRHGRPDFEGPGMGRPEFDRPGPHGPEFKREGPHGPEFDRQGPGRPEFDRRGRPEFNRPGPHGPEFDRPGPHHPEFDRPGPPNFDRHGPPDNEFNRHGPPRSDTDKGTFRPEFDRHRDMDGHRGPPRREFEGEFERDGPPFDRHRKYGDNMEEEDRYRERFDRHNRGRDQDWHENREYDPEFDRHGRRDDEFDKNRRRRGHGPDTRDGEFEPRDRDWNRGHDDKHTDRDRSDKQPDRKSPEKVNKNDKPSKRDDIEKTKNENSRTEKKPQPVQEEKKEEKLDTKKSGKAFDPNKGLPPWRPVDSPVKKPSKMDKQSNREDRREDRRSPPLKDRRTPPLKDRRTPPLKDQKVSDKLPSILDGIEPELIANQGLEGPERPAFPTGPSFNPLPSQLPGIPDPPHVKLEREKQIEKEKKDKQKSNRQDKNDKRKEEKRSSKEKDDRRGTRAEKEDRRGRQNKEDKRGPGRLDKDERRGRPDRDDRRDRFNTEDRRGHLQPLHPQDFVESYVDKYGDPRFRSFTDMGPEVSEEVVFGKRNYEIKLGAPPRKIQWGNGYIEVYADPSKRGVVIDNELMYRFGERVKEVNIRGKREKMFYHGQPLDIWIDGNNYEVRVDSPPKTLIINNQPHRIQVDGRDMMILINKAEMGPYGGEPRFILIGDMRMELRFDPPPRHILIDGEMCELKLNTNQPCINIKGVLHGIRFKGPPRDLFINGTCYQVHTDHAVKLKVGNRFHYVALGGPCHELIIDGKWYEVKFDEPPKEISVGNRALMVHIPGGPPEVKILDPIPIDPVHMPMFNPAGPMRMPMPGPPGPLGPMGPGPGPMGPPQMIPGMPPGMMMGPPVTGPNPMVNPAIPSMRPPMAPQPTTGIPGLGGVIPGIQPTQSNSLPMSGMGPTPGMPSVLSGLFPARPAVPTTSAPGGGLDINSLLSKLVSSGIIKKDGETKQQLTPVIETPALAPSKPAKSDNSAIVAEAIRVAAKKKTFGMNKSKTIPDKTSFDLSDLKELHDGAIDRLYAGTQCTSCGARFLLDSEEKTAKYQQHLDWHFRQNKLKKDDTKVTQFRKWYYGVGDWIQYEEVTDLDEQAKSVFFEQQKPAQPATPANPQHTITLPEGLSVIKCPPATGNDQDDLCNICHEPFEQYWDEEQEQWHLREAIRVNNKTYHPICYEDYTDVSEGTPSPSILLDKQPDFSSRKSLTYEESSQDGIPHSSFEEERNVPNVSPTIKTEPVMALETKIKSEPENYTTDSGVKIETDSNIGDTSALSGGQLGTSIKQEPALSDSVSSTSGLSQDSQYVVKYEPMEGEEGQSEFLSSNHRKGAIPGLEVSVSETEHVDTSDTKTMETDSDNPHTSDSVVKMETSSEDIVESDSIELKPMETAESSVSSFDPTSDRATPTLDEDAQLEHIEGHSAYNHPSQSLITEQSSSSLSYTTESAFHRPSQLHHIDSNTETHSLNVPSHHSSTLSPLKRVIVSQPADMIEISQEVLEISSNASTPTHDELPSPPSPGS